MVKSSLEYESRKTTRRSKRRRASVDFSRASFCALHTLRARLCTTTSRVAGFYVRARASRARRPPTARARQSASRDARRSRRRRRERGAWKLSRRARVERRARRARGAREGGHRATSRARANARAVDRGKRAARAVDRGGGRARGARAVVEYRAGWGRARTGRTGRARAREGRVRGGLIDWGICGRGAVRTAVVDARARRWGAGGRAGCVRGKRTDDRRA